MAKIVFLDRDTMGADIPVEQGFGTHDLLVRARTEPEEVVLALAGADIAITNKVPITDDMLGQLPDLRMIAVAATGYDVVDTAACSRRGVTVSNVPDYATTTVPEHVFALIFALRRNLVAYRQDVINGTWQASRQFCFLSHQISDLAGSRLGIIGRGALGLAVAEIGAALGMEPVFASRKERSPARSICLGFEEVLATADIISLHVPLTSETRHMISDREFAMMQRSPILINTARGQLIDEASLVRALDGGQISGAGLDVLSTEPPEPDNPLLAVLNRPNVIVTPHIAWASSNARKFVWTQTMNNIGAYLEGHPINVVSA